MPEALRTLIPTPRIRRALKRYAGKDRRRRQCIKDTLERMAANIFDPTLRTHALTGSLAGFHACSCGYDCRVVFQFVRNPREKTEDVLLIGVGTHDEVY